MFVNNDNIVIKSILWEGIRYDLYKDHTLIMTLSNNINSNLRLYESIISLKPKKIVIKNARDIEVLKVLIKKIKYMNIDTEIDLISDTLPILKGLYNKYNINFDKIPKNLKIDGFKTDNEQTEFSTWAHNLSEENKIKLISHLTDNSKSIFLKQERAIKENYKLIKSYYPNIDKMPKKEAFELIYHIISRSNIDRYDKYLKNGTSILRGYKANLLTLFTNNNLFNINCVNSKGTSIDKHLYIWNELILEDGSIVGYDIENNVNDNDILHNPNYVYYRVYPIILDLKKGYFKNNIDSAPIRVNKKL
ncbi:MAG: hypothetical protein IIZ40_01690 [Bacilli bacterium]|nr:hypothetical protein [Bacilli bacterium]